MNQALASSQARPIADLALAVPHVVGLGGGGAGATTYVPGERVRGVRIDGNHVVVHVVVDADGPSLPAIASEVRDRIRSGVAAVEDVDVVIADLVGADDPPRPPQADGPAVDTQVDADERTPPATGPEGFRDDGLALLAQQADAAHEPAALTSGLPEEQPLTSVPAASTTATSSGREAEPAAPVATGATNALEQRADDASGRVVDAAATVADAARTVAEAAATVASAASTDARAAAPGREAPAPADEPPPLPITTRGTTPEPDLPAPEPAVDAVVDRRDEG